MDLVLWLVLFVFLPVEDDQLPGACTPHAGGFLCTPVEIEG